MGEFEFYRYSPNKGASIAFAVLFGIACCSVVIALSLQQGRNFSRAHVMGQMSSKMVNCPLRWYNMIKLSGAYFPFVVGCVLEIIGYAARCFSANNQMALTPYVIQDILILIAPAFYAATIYMLFGRVAHLLFAEQLLIMPAKYNTLVFVLGDVLSLLLQAAGGGLMSQESTMDTGTGIIIGGLFVQIAFFGFFILNEFFFLLKIRTIHNGITSSVKSFTFLNNILLTSSILILVRSIVRAVEFIQGNNGTIMSNEWFLYVFDASPLFVTTLLFLVSLYCGGIFKVQKQSLNWQISDKFSSTD